MNVADGSPPQTKPLQSDAVEFLRFNVLVVFPALQSPTASARYRNIGFFSLGVSAVPEQDESQPNSMIPKSLRPWSE